MGDGKPASSGGEIRWITPDLLFTQHHNVNIFVIAEIIDFVMFGCTFRQYDCRSDDD